MMGLSVVFREVAQNLGTQCCNFENLQVPTLQCLKKTFVWVPNYCLFLQMAFSVYTYNMADGSHYEKKRPNCVSWWWVVGRGEHAIALTRGEASLEIPCLCFNSWQSFHLGGFFCDNCAQIFHLFPFQTNDLIIMCGNNRQAGYPWLKLHSVEASKQLTKWNFATSGWLHVCMHFATLIILHRSTIPGALAGA